MYIRGAIGFWTDGVMALLLYKLLMLDVDRAESSEHFMLKIGL